MKKILGIGLLMMLSVCCLFGEANSKKAFLGIHDFVNNPSENWNLRDGYFFHIDPMNEEYKFVGSFTIKVLLTTSRYDFICTVKNTPDNMVVELSDMESYSCDKNGQYIKNSKVIQTSNKVASQYADQIKTEIQARISKISDSVVDAEYAKVVAQPDVFFTITDSMSDLAVKKFVEANINGNEVELEVKLGKIDENRHPLTNELYPLCYKATGYVPLFKSGFGRFIMLEDQHITIYSKNDKLLTAKAGSSYKVKGKLEVKFIDHSATFWSYSISEE